MALPNVPVPDSDTIRIIERQFDRIEDWLSIARENKDDLLKMIGSFSLLTMAAGQMTHDLEVLAHEVIDPELLSDEICENCEQQHVNEDIVNGIDDFEDMLAELIDHMNQQRIVERRNGQKDV